MTSKKPAIDGISHLKKFNAVIVDCICVSRLGTYPEAPSIQPHIAAPNDIPILLQNDATILIKPSILIPLEINSPYSTVSGTRPYSIQYPAQAPNVPRLILNTINNLLRVLLKIKNETRLIIENSAEQTASDLLLSLNLFASLVANNPPKAVGIRLSTQHKA